MPTSQARLRPSDDRALALALAAEEQPRGKDAADRAAEVALLRDARAHREDAQQHGAVRKGDDQAEDDVRPAPAQEAADDEVRDPAEDHSRGADDDVVDRCEQPGEDAGRDPVSYTHLTLPTIYSV